MGIASFKDIHIFMANYILNFLLALTFFLQTLPPAPVFGYESGQTIFSGNINAISVDVQGNRALYKPAFKQLQAFHFPCHKNLACAMWQNQTTEISLTTEQLQITYRTDDIRLHDNLAGQDAYAQTVTKAIVPVKNLSSESITLNTGLPVIDQTPALLFVSTPITTWLAETITVVTQKIKPSSVGPGELLITPITTSTDSSDWVLTKIHTETDELIAQLYSTSTTPMPVPTPLVYDHDLKDNSLTVITESDLLTIKPSPTQPDSWSSETTNAFTVTVRQAPVSDSKNSGATATTESIKPEETNLAQSQNTVSEVSPFDEYRRDLTKTNSKSLPPTESSTPTALSFIVRQKQQTVDSLVDAAGSGNKQQVSQILKKHFYGLLFDLHSITGNSALHAAIEAQQTDIILLIKDHCPRFSYYKLLNHENSQQLSPLQLLLMSSDDSESLQPEPETSAATVASADGLADETSAISSQSNQANIITLVQGILNWLFGYKQEESASAHPFIERAEKIDINIQHTDAAFDKYNLDLRRFKPSKVSEVSAGRAECAVHPGFYHADASLPCCQANICQTVIVVLSRMMISSYTSTGDDNVACPVCSQSLDLTKFLEKLNAKLIERRRLVCAVSPLLTSDDHLKMDSNIMLLNEELQLGTATICFTDEILSILHEHIIIKQLFQKRVSFFEDTECGICTELKQCMQLSDQTSECNHKFCRLCLITFMTQASVDLNTLSTGTLNCPGNNCQEVIPDFVVQALSGKNTITKLHKSLNKLSASRNKNLFICLNSECETLIDVENIRCMKVICPACKNSNCRECQVTPFHEGWSCEMYRKALTSDGANKMFEEAKKKEPHYFKKCPNCKADIYLAQGCNMVHCTHCQTKFCWLCMKIIEFENYLHFKEGKCSLWKQKPILHDDPESVTKAGQPKPVEHPYCMRCQTENMLNQWLCGHYFCNACEMHLITEAAENDLDATLCIACAIATSEDYRDDEQQQIPEAENYEITVEPIQAYEP